MADVKEQPEKEGQEEHGQEPPQLYSLPGLDGEWSLQQLVDMEMERDPRLNRVRRSALPHEFWDARRRASNHARLQRNYVKRKRKGDALRQEEEELLAGLGEEEAAEYAAAREAQREAAKAAAAAQRERVAAAMEGGLRIVVDCSLSAAPPAAPVESNGGREQAAQAGGVGEHGGEAGGDCKHTDLAGSGKQDDGSGSGTSGGGKGGKKGGKDKGAAGGASDREVRSLCKQLELCASANKRAAAPVSLQFTSFTGPVRAFAVEGMHADRWPAARGHEAPLAQLFPAHQLVVLSPDAQETLLGGLEPDKVYVIGGLVDRTVQKGASLRLAQRAGARAVRLPIAEHLGPLQTGRGVLNVNDVFSALLAVHAGQGWQAALEAAIPKRFRQAQAGGRRAAAAAAQVAPAAQAQPTAAAAPLPATATATATRTAPAAAAAPAAAPAPAGFQQQQGVHATISQQVAGGVVGAAEQQDSADQGHLPTAAIAAADGDS